MLMLFISLGRWLEHVAKVSCVSMVQWLVCHVQGKTSQALTALMSLQATSATLVTIAANGSVASEREIDIQLVQQGSIC